MEAAFTFRACSLACSSSRACCLSFSSMRLKDMPVEERDDTALDRVDALQPRRTGDKDTAQRVRARIQTTPVNFTRDF